MERPWTSTASALLQNMSARVNQGCVQGQGQLALTSGSSSEYSSSASTSSLFIDLSSTGLSARFSLVTSHPSTKTIHFFSDTARIKTQLSFFFVNGEVAVCDVDGLSVEDVRSDRFFALKPLFSFFVVDIYSFGCIISGSNTALLYNCLQIPIRELRRASIMLRKSKILPCNIGTCKLPFQSVLSFLVLSPNMPIYNDHRPPQRILKPTSRCSVTPSLQFL